MNKYLFKYINNSLLTWKKVKSFEFMTLVSDKSFSIYKSPTGNPKK